MNYNILSYLIYGCIMVYIIYKVGLICYRNGNVFVLHLMPTNTQLCLYINNILLTGYYLLNIGYAVYSISTWKTIQNTYSMIDTIASHVGSIVLTLAVLHYMNIIVLQLFFKSKKQHI
ncbi:hypothetical protein GCM10011344_31650 [Dokdonia pacifica]|uniref:Uncharacterized protein n=1 Tax=Dokdonia pacifica TaxID=1627892 RepID=A0A239BLX7_9FLAO|nr:hypothetical protein [Dokdonia pacifica]GGG28552.1 hypothetical protein GCM10011344_31650 [Dokdonia pacifica]SNS09177.1 hypothetical protein SAMN06265376_106304 [Dokdonia pacifica]